MENYIFDFNDRNALCVQDDRVCESLYRDFFATLVASDELSSFRETVARFESQYQLHWLAHYGSVILFKSIDVLSSSATVVDLDKWSQAVHASVEGRENTAIADVTASVLFEVGPVPTARIDGILEQFRKALEESQANTGSARRQAAGHNGNQKTPSFARTILLQVIRDSKEAKLIEGVQDSQEALSIQGGTTDVGLHTGCIPRNTSFPLVLSAFHTMLRFSGESPDECFKNCVVTYFMRQLDGIVSSIACYNARLIDRAIFVVREFEDWMNKLNDAEFQGEVLDRIETHYSLLVGLSPVADPATQEVALESVADVCTGLSHPTFPEIPASVVNCVGTTQQLEHARLDARKNLAWTNLASPTVSDDNVQDAWVELSQLNIYFWASSHKLEDGEHAYGIDDLLAKLDRHEKAVKVVQKAAELSSCIMSGAGQL